MADQNDPRPVAVVAVHGVGYCPPYSISRHIASLLLGLGRLRLREGVDWPKGGATTPQPYQSCVEEFIQIPLERAKVGNADAAQARLVPSARPAPKEATQNAKFPEKSDANKAAQNARFSEEATQRGNTGARKKPSRLKHGVHFFAESRGYVADVFAGRRKPEEVKEDIKDRSRLSREFMRSQLAGYVSTQDGQAWDTIRLRTERAAPPGTPPRKVDIYECYWADLARPQGSVLGFFNALYQLLFHLASLSRTAVDYAAVEHIHLFRWRVVCFLQALAVRLLVIFIPILNLLLLIAGLTVLPLNIGLHHRLLAAGLFGLLIFFALLYRPRTVPRHFSAWLAMLAAAYGLGFLSAFLPLWFFKNEPRGGDVALAVEWWFLGEIVLWLLMKRYETVRRGALSTGLTLGVAAFLMFFAFVGFHVNADISNPVEQASLWTMEVLFATLSSCWFALLLSAVGTWIAHVWCLWPLRRDWVQSRREKKDQAHTAARLATYARALSAFRTGRLSLAVSASMIALVTIFLWAGAFSYTNRTFNLFAGVNVDQRPPLASVTAWSVPTYKEARWWVRKADTEKAKEACGEDSPKAENSCEAGTDAPANGPGCGTFSGKPLNDLQNRLVKVQQILTGKGNLAGQIPAELPARLYTLEEAAGINYPEREDLETQLAEKQRNNQDTKEVYDPEMPGKFKHYDRNYGCVYRVYLLESKVGIAGHTEFHVLARALLLSSTTSGLPVMIAFIVLALIVLGWAVARSLIPDSTALNLATNRQCMQLADWLSRGLDSTRAVTSLFWHSIFTVLLLFGILDSLYSKELFSPYLTDSAWLRVGIVKLDWLIATSLQWLDQIGASLAISGAAIAAVIYRYGRAPLDILLDVDNYLRTSPLENAPRARIAERYVSLLRYIAARKDARDPTKPYYGSVVIVAHSLGALISADLLHFLKEEPDPALRPLGYGEKNQKDAAIEIRLLTFGNPLRQLLNRFFPHIYWWVREEPDNGARSMPKAVEDPPDLLRLPATPRVSDLGAAVKLWFSAYRSGDFVGRMLWSDHWFCRNNRGPDEGQYSNEKKADVTVIRDADPPHTRRAEMCIGLGGHNDYWNRTAPDMASQLDLLIQMEPSP